jgi:hypothetical protein
MDMSTTHITDLERDLNQTIMKGDFVKAFDNGDLAFSEWEYDMTRKGRGRGKMCEVAVRHWKNGQVARKRFYYKGM